MRLIDSMRIHVSYEREGFDFQTRLQNQYKSLWDQFLRNVQTDVQRYLQDSTTSFPLRFHPTVTAAHAQFNTSPISFAGLGMQPPQTVPMRCGFPVALIEHSLPQLTPHGAISWEVTPTVTANI